jgi:hypothetical protein
MQAKKGGGRIELTDGSFEIRVKSPMAAAIVETAVGE